MILFFGLRILDKTSQGQIFLLFTAQDSGISPLYFVKKIIFSIQCSDVIKLALSDFLKLGFPLGTSILFK